MAKRGTAEAKPRLKKVKQPRPVPSYPKLPSVWSLAGAAGRTIYINRQLFIGIAAIYGLLELVLVRGFSSGLNAASLKSTSGASILSIFSQMLGNQSGSTGGGSAWQFGLLVVVSLAIIWSLRQVLSGTKVRIRDSFYRGMNPLVPFAIIVLVVALEFIPAVIGAYIYAGVISSGIGIGVLEKMAFGLLFGLLAFISLYLLTSSLFGLYIVTLPDMTPLKALRSARQLVYKRRLVVLRKIVGLPVALLIILAVIMLPVIAILAAVASWLLFLLGLLVILAVHSYMYTLYRELLNE